MSRFLSNSLMLAVFCACFYLLTSSINWLASGHQHEQSHEFSFDRRQADQFWHKRRWSDAAVYYKNLTESDPYNGNAWFFLAECVGNQRYEMVRKIYQAEKKGSDEKRIDEYRKRAKEIGVDAVAYYKKAVGFPRFANRSRYNIACILAFGGDADEALEYLQEAVNNSYYCNVRGGLGNAYELRSLRGLSDFDEVCQTERENYNRSHGGRLR